MATFTSNLQSPASIALNNKKSGSLLSQATTGTPRISPYATSTTYQSTVPAAQLASIKSTPVQTPVSTAPVSKSVLSQPVLQPKAVPLPTSPGEYKGTAINAGNDASIAAQMAQIDRTPEVKSTPTANPNPKPVPSPVYSPPQAPPTYTGLVGNIAGQGNALNRQAGLVNETASQIGQYGQMTREESQARQRLAGIPGILSTALSTIESTPSENAVQMGREAVAGRNVESQRQSLAAQVEAYASERAANIAGYQGQANAQNQAAGVLNQAGGQYGTATGYAAPILGQYGQANYNPLGGSASGEVASTDPFYSTLQSYAQQAANGQYASIPTSITSNPVLNNQMNELARRINPDYNPVSSNAISAVTGQQTQQVEGYKSALQQGQNLGSQLNDLISTFGLNPSELNKANSGLQLIAANTSNPNYQSLRNYVNDIANTYAQVLTPHGGTATDTTRGIATSMLDSAMSGKGLKIVLDSLDNAAKAKIAGVSTTGSTFTNTAAGGGNYSNGAATSAGGYEFVYRDGKWVVK